MNDFAIYFDLGLDHILSWDAWDHILFIVTLSSIYLIRDWKKVLILVTAFTIGHSITLALSVYDIFRVQSKWVEFLIPVTIIITGIFNFMYKKRELRSLDINYFFALFFGLIHGLGFANNIRFMLSKEQEIVGPLLSFNLGIEAGQVVLVICLLLAGFALVNMAGLKQKWWIWSLSATGVIWASIMTLQRLPWI
jgi:HupE / UreJ protein